MGRRLARSARLVLWLGALLGAAPVAARDPGARSLADARVAHLVGTASADGRPLQAGSGLAAVCRLRTGADAEARLELRFGDGTLLRLGPGSDAALQGAERRVLLRAGRLLVQADRMIGGVAVWTPAAALEPLGTTYLVEVDPEGGVYVLVLEGAVQVVRPPQTPERVLLPGEALHLPPGGGPGRPATRAIGGALEDEPLLRAFPQELPSLQRLRDLWDQQRRGVLAGRNERLRRELGWRRPPRRPIVLPELFR